MTAYIELKADDMMPWGKYKGLTLRSIYKKDLAFYKNLCKQQDAYGISKTTKRIIELDLPQTEQSTLSYSKNRGSKKELLFKDTLPSGPYKGKTLLDVFVINPSYYRYLCESSNYYISKETFNLLSFGKKIVDEAVNTLREKNTDAVPKETRASKGSKKTSASKKKKQEPSSSEEDLSIEEVILEPSAEARKKYTEQIDANIEICWNNLNPETDLPNYIGERVTGHFSPNLSRTITNNLKKDKYHLQKALEEIYDKGATFHDGQDKAIAAVLEGKKTLVVQSTGWGKSLVYFLSIKKLREMGKGPAIIISPLIALMRNQIESETVKKTQLSVREINSENEKEWPQIYADIKADKVDAIMIAPEKLYNTRFLSEIKDIIPYISLFVVDEAHCISDWGHDFRVSFRRIVKFVQRFSPNTAILATTATANDRVVRDIKYQLGKDLEVLRGDMNRKNFEIDIIRFGSDYGKLCWLVRNLPKLNQKGCGIIYCLTVKDCKKVTKYLCEKGLNARAYYARLDPKEKMQIEKDFQNDKISILVATVAFGMGVDKKNIAYVVHYQQPAGVIAYYQQIGRAGRNIDAVPVAKAIMLVGDDDNDTNIYFITHAFPTGEDLTKAIDYVSQHPECSRQEMMDEYNWNKDKADKIIEYLLVDGYLFRHNSRYTRSDREWTCDMKRSRIVSGFRWKELREFNRFIDSKECYMKQIRNALDDPTTQNCGHCANCIGKHFYE